MTTPEARAVAERIADDLLRSGYGGKAKRLVLELPGAQYAGALYWHDLVDRITDHLTRPYVPQEEPNNATA